jgi:hypothetical protein
MPRKIDLAYLAGVIDSDGTIGIKKSTYSMRVVGDSSAPSYSERIHIRQVTPQAIALLSETFGGNIGTEDPSAKRGKPLYRWGATDIKATNILRALLPYLKIKRKQAENCLALRDVKQQSKRQRIAKGRGHIGSSSRSAESGLRMEALYIQAKILNSVGV